MLPRFVRKRLARPLVQVLLSFVASSSGCAREPAPSVTAEVVRVAGELDAERPPPGEQKVTVEADAIEALLALDPSVSASIGGPNDGRVEGAVAFPLEGPGFRFNPRRRPAARFGSVEMVQALVRAARLVHSEMPGGELLVNDLGHAQGGPIPQHGSHQSGRDVDTLFYLLDEHGRPMPSVGAPLDPAGEGVDFRDLAVPEDDVPVRLDVARTFRFVQALLEDQGAAVQRIFVAEHLRTLLVGHARSIGAPPAVVSRFEELTCQPGSPHDDHLHIRFFCAPDDIPLGCEDERPIYPWRRAELLALNTTPVIARPRPDRPRAQTTSASEARERAGVLDPAVVAWLERRETWLRPPYTARRFCR